MKKVVVIFLLFVCSVAFGQGKESKYNFRHTFSKAVNGGNWASKEDNVGWWRQASWGEKREYTYVMAQGMYAMAYFVWLNRKGIGLDTGKYVLYDLIDTDTLVGRVDEAIKVLGIPDWLGMVYVFAIVWDAPVLGELEFCRWEEKLYYWRLYPERFFEVEK